jgi:1,4-dihydroxy-2-naphthoate octaprenyltransferase
MFDLTLWLCVFVGLTMAHAANNLINDLMDYRSGVDHNNYFRAQYGPQPLVHGLLNQRGLLLYIAVTGALALIPGVYLVYLRGTLALELLLIGAGFVIFYTWPLKYIGMGEIAVLLVWGPLMVGGGYFGACLVERMGQVVEKLRGFSQPQRSRIRIKLENTFDFLGRSISADVVEQCG